MAFLRSRRGRFVALLGALLLVLLVLLVTVVIGWGAWQRAGAVHGDDALSPSFAARVGRLLRGDDKQRASTKTARIETVGTSDIVSSVRASGQVRPVREVQVGTLATGQLQQLAVKLGQRVTRGQLLATIDPSLADNAIRRERARVEEAGAQRDAAATQFALLAKKRARAQGLKSTDAGSQQDLEQAEADWARQRAALAERRAALIRARILLDDAITEKARTRIVAPIAGEVTEIKILEGQTVVATQTAQVILTLADVTTMTVAAQVSEADIARVAVGQRVRFSVLAAADRQRDGVIREIEPTPVKKTGDASRAIYYQALFDVDNADGMLRPMMTANVDIIAAQAAGVLTIPLMALLSSAGDGIAGDDAQAEHAPKTGYVYRVDREGRRHRQAVRLGMRSDARIEVEAGLAAGDRIVADAGWRE